MNSGVFISHKLNDPPTEAFLTSLRPELKALGCHVWVDTDIAPGEVWRQELSAWMSHCSCAVLLISRKALESDWIFQEASILSWRQEQDRNFKLFPVVLDGLTDSEISASRLKVVLEILRLQSPGRNGTDDQKLSATVEAVKTVHLQSKEQKRNEFTLAVRDIVHTLKDTPNDALESAMDYLKVESGPWFPGWDSKRVFALKLLSLPPLKMWIALNKLETIPSIKGQIGKLALPFWVDTDAARTLCRSALMPDRRPLMLLNTARGDTAFDYVTRATFSPNRTWICHQTSGVFGEGFEEDIWQEICQCIALSSGWEISDMDPARIQERVENSIQLDTEDSRQFVAIDIRNLGKATDWLRLEELRSHHGGVVYLLLTGANLPPDNEWAATIALPLMPEIDAGLETSVHSLRDRFHQFCNQSH